MTDCGKTTVTNSGIVGEFYVPDYVTTCDKNFLIGNKKLDRTLKVIFKDGTEAVFNLEKNDGALQEFFDAAQNRHELEIENNRLQEQLKEANEIIISFDKLVGKLTGTVFQNVLDYYKKYNVDRYKKTGV